MSKIIYPIYYNLKWNLTACEAILLIVGALIINKYCKKRAWSFTVYYVFVILYITLMHRQPLCERTVNLKIDLLPLDEGWAGNLLNLILYIPLGLASYRWKSDRKKIVLGGFLLSVFCEIMQFVFSRGMADINDVLCNTVGITAGVCVAKRMSERKLIE